jgi:hypothetical protein
MPSFGSRLFGSAPLSSTAGLIAGPPIPGIPADLDAAIAARFAADATLTSLAAPLYAERADDSARMPYVVARVGGGSPALESSDSTWLGQRVRFECFASTTAAAGLIARAVMGAFGSGPSDGVALSFSGGVTTPMTTAGNVEVAEKNRGVNNARVCRATVTYAITARIGRPS